MVCWKNFRPKKRKRIQERKLRTMSKNNLEEVRIQVNETKDIMEENIESILSNQTNIVSLQEKSKDTLEESKRFKKRSTKLRRGEQINYYKYNSLWHLKYLLLYFCIHHNFHYKPRQLQIEWVYLLLNKTR